MYNPVNEINAFKGKALLIPHVAGIGTILLDEASSRSAGRQQDFTDKIKPELQFIPKSRASKNHIRRKTVSLAGDYCWASMVSHNSGAAAAKRRIAKTRHEQERLVSNLFQTADAQTVLSELTNPRHLDFLNRLLLDVRKMRSHY